jgi:branched-chain amino acid aminotransferase
MYVLLNDALIREEEANLVITDLAIQRGYGIFDFLKTVAGEPVFFEDHLDRFFNSAAEMRLAVKYSREELKELIYTLIRKNQLDDSGIKITLTGGYSPDGFTIAEPNLIVTQHSFQINRDPEKSIGIITYDYQRQFATAKTLDYLKAIWLQPVLKEQGADDVLYHDGGVLRECPRANFFLISPEGEVLTSVNHILKGVSRKHILNVASRNYPTGERDITLDDLRNAKEAFVSSTTKNILPVTRIDGKVLGDGRPGEVTRRLAKDYDNYIYG